MRFESASEILSRLDENAAHAYAWRKAWLIRTDRIAPSLNPFSAKKIPGLRPSRLAGVALSNLNAAPLMLHTSADAVQISQDGHRLRTFDMRTGTSLKIARQASVYGDGMAREIALRTGILRTSGLNIPAMDETDVRDGFLYARETLLRGRLFHPRRDMPRFVDEVATPLAGFYRTYGVTKKHLSDMIPEIAAFAGEHKAADANCAHVTALLERNPEVATSLNHNDLKASNLVVSGGKIHIIDWELADIGICGRDFVMMRRKNPLFTGIDGKIDQIIRNLHDNALNLADMRAIYRTQALFKLKLRQVAV